jgi:hypothetical protein
MEPMELLMVSTALAVSVWTAYALQRALLGAMLLAIDPNRQHKTALR